MDVITLARELGKALQQEETYINWQNAQHVADADTELQQLIGEFNLKRMIINDEAGKKDRDQEKLTHVLNRVNAIIQQSAQGADPDTADAADCTGSCSTCGGCS